jgi:hypothetical protein
MKTIVDALDAWTAQEYSGVTRKLWGYCEMGRKSAKGSSGNSTEQPFPMAIIDGSSERHQVAIKDSVQLNTWTRLNGNIGFSNSIEGQEWGFGLEQGKVQVAPLRWIVAHKVGLGEDWILEFLKSLPVTLDVTGYQVVSIDKNSISVDTDHEAIYRAELGETGYEKHRFTWNIYAISLNVEFIPCEE